MQPPVWCREEVAGGLAGEHGNPGKAPARKLSLEGIFHWCQQAQDGLGGTRGAGGTGCVAASKGGAGACERWGTEGTARGAAYKGGTSLVSQGCVCVCVQGRCISAVHPDVQGRKTSAVPRDVQACMCKGDAAAAPGLCKGRARRGTPPMSHRLRVQGGRTSAVPQMCVCARQGQLCQLCTQNTGDGGVQRPHHTHMECLGPP